MAALHVHEPAGESWQMLMHGIATHARLEEELLLPALASRTDSGDPDVQHWIDVHRDLSPFMTAMDDPARPDIASTSQVIALMRHHFRQEEEHLFALARRLLTPAHLEQLGRSWAEAREIRPDPEPVQL